MEGSVETSTVNRKAFALLFLGASLYWPLLRRNGLFFSLGGHDATNAESMFWLSMFLLLCAVFVAVCCVVERRAGELVERHGAVLLAICGMQVVCKMLGILVAPAGFAGGLLALLDVALYAFVFVVLTYMWSSWYVAMERRESVLFSSATFAASFVISDVVRVLPPGIGLVLFALFPFVSAFTWVAFHDAECPRLPVQDAEALPAGPFAWRLVAILAVFLVVGGLIRGAMTDVVDGSLATIMLAMDVATFLFGAMLLVFSLLYRSSGRFLMNAWSAAVVMFFAGLLLTVGLSGDSVERGRQVVLVGRTCLDLIYWIVLVGLVRDQHLSLIRTIGVWFILIDIMSSLVGYIIAPMVLAAMGVGFEQTAVPLATATAFILIVASILFFNRAFGEPRLDGGSPAGIDAGADPLAGPTGEPASPIDAASLEAERTELVDSVLAGYHLTERELEVAELLADGNSQKKIAETLFLSLGTVQSHIKSIYRKLDIHSRQEFIDLMRG